MQRMAALLTGDIRLAFHTPMDGVETAVAAAPDAGLKTTFESACEGGPLPAVPPPPPPPRLLPCSSLLLPSRSSAEDHASRAAGVLPGHPPAAFPRSDGGRKSLCRFQPFPGSATGAVRHRLRPAAEALTGGNFAVPGGSRHSGNSGRRAAALHHYTRSTS